MITSNRKEPLCKDEIGGVKEMYIMPFQLYSRTQIVLDSGKVELLSFPDTLVNRISLRPDSNKYNESYSIDGHYNQTINITLLKQDLPTTRQIKTLLNGEFRVILRMNNGSLKIFGLENGLTVNNVNIDNGSSHNSMNGYTFSFNGMERFKAQFLESLESVGFVIDENVDSYTFQDNIIYTFQDNITYEF